MTLDVYADLFDDDLDTVSASLNDARNRSMSLHQRDSWRVGTPSNDADTWSARWGGPSVVAF